MFRNTLNNYGDVVVEIPDIRIWCTGNYDAYEAVVVIDTIATTYRFKEEEFNSPISIDTLIMLYPDITDKIYKAAAALKEARAYVENILSRPSAGRISNKVTLEKSGARLYLLLD